MRSALAFVMPALLANLILFMMPLLGRRRARNTSTRVIGTLAPRLAGFRIHIDGDHEALTIRPAVLVFNHQSGIDPVVMAAIAGRDCIGVAKHNLRRHPLLGPLLRLSGTLFVDTSGRNPDILEHAAARLKQDIQAVAIAPESSRARTLQPFRAGALRLAQTANVPIVAVVIHNSAEILAPGALIMRRGIVNVSVLPAHNPQALSLDQLEQMFRDALADDTAA